jgi:predicted HAD superfamily Cof-like phosphohydrolase
VRAFHERFGVPVSETPRVSSKQRTVLRMDLLAEEFDELDDALWAVVHAARGEVDGARALVSAADAIADLIYVCIGTALELGIPLDRVWDKVHSSNMRKVGGGKRDDGKILKPDGWVGPDIAACLWPKEEDNG